jgi:chemotaxis protein methyltransferase CheR
MKSEASGTQVSEAIGDSLLGANAPVLSSAEFDRIRNLVYKHLGIHLVEQKQSLVAGRLNKILRRLQCRSFTEYCDYLEADRTGIEWSELANAISTNHTFFNREKSHFDFLVRKAMPEIVQAMKAQNTRDFRMWCAASSTGQEPYTLAILIRRFFGKDLAQWDTGLLATDISEKALQTARNGLYSAEELNGLPADWIKEFFIPQPNGFLAASPALKKEITYRRFNLINEAYPFKKPFHVIFCRNVMIYFDPPTKDKVVRNMASFLVPGGYLFIGHSESLGRLSDQFTYVEPAVYRRK